MSHRIYTPEFKDEAVRQVVERGCERWEKARVTLPQGHPSQTKSS